MIRRIFGLETEFGLTCVSTDGATLNPEEAARYLFRKVVNWGRSSNVFLGNGARLYLDVGSHPEYATAECDDLYDLIAHDKAGEEILRSLLSDAHSRFAKDGLDGTIHLFKNNLDSAGNSYGCHENYLINRKREFARAAQVLIPFLVTRQVLTGAGHILDTPSGPIYCFSQRADHLWGETSSATTRSRPLINTRDEPHADPEKYRRLHVISGDSSMSEATILLKMGSTDLLLRMLEDGWIFPSLSLDNPVRALRDISHDIEAVARVDLADSRRLTAVEIQRLYLEQVRKYLARSGHHGKYDASVLDLWQRGLDALSSGDHSGIETELDWAIKKRLIDRYRTRASASLGDARVRRLELAYHDISGTTPLLKRLERAGQVRRLIDPARIGQAVTTPPATTRATLRGRFIREAASRRRDYTVDWVHLKLNDYTGSTLLCKDPFATEDSRLDELIATMGPPGDEALAQIAP